MMKKYVMVIHLHLHPVHLLDHWEGPDNPDKVFLYSCSPLSFLFNGHYGRKWNKHIDPVSFNQYAVIMQSSKNSGIVSF